MINFNPIHRLSTILFLHDFFINHRHFHSKTMMSFDWVALYEYNIHACAYMEVPTWIWHFVLFYSNFLMFLLVYCFRCSQFILQTASSLNPVAAVKSCTYIKLDLFCKHLIVNTCNVIIKDFTIESSISSKYYSRNRVV